VITEHDLQEAIAECEGQRNPSANTCLKLAAFYIIKDKMYPAKREVKEETMNERPLYTQYSGSYENEQSEFRQALKLVDSERFLSVMDELMTTLKAIMPKLYDGVMQKLIN
jgi:hypothetical protein